MGTITTLINIASKTSGAIKQAKKASKTEAISKTKKPSIKYNGKMSFKDPIESMTNPKSDYYVSAKFEAPAQAESSALDEYKKKSIFGKEKVDWESALQNQEIRNAIKFGKGDLYNRFAKEYAGDREEIVSKGGYSRAERIKRDMIAYDDEKLNQKSSGVDALLLDEKIALGMPFVGHLAGEALDTVKLKPFKEGHVPLSDRYKIRNELIASGDVERDWESTLVAGGINFLMGAGIYKQAEMVAGLGISALSRSKSVLSPAAQAVDKARITSPKLFAIATSSLTEVAEYGFRKSTGDENYTKWDLLGGLVLGGGFSAAFGGTAAKSVKDSITARDLKNIEAALSKSEIGVRNADEAYELIKDVKLDNGFTVSEASEVIAENGKKMLGKKRGGSITADDVFTSTQGGANGANINNATAHVIADVLNQAKKDIDNAPSGGMFSKGTDEEATAIMNDVIAIFGEKGKVYSTDDASDIIQGIVSKYGKNYTVNPDKNYEIDDLMHDIISNGNGKKLAGVKSIDDIYTLAGRKSRDVKMDDINSLQKTLDDYDILLSSTKKGSKVKIDSRKQSAIVKQLDELAEKANYNIDTKKLFNKDGSINVVTVQKAIDDIETHSFTNSVRYNNKVRQAEDLLISSTKGYSRKISKTGVSNIKAGIKSVTKSFTDGVSAGKDVIKIITGDASSYLNQSTKGKTIARGIMNEMSAKLSSAKSVSDVKKIVHETVKKMYVKEAQFLKKQIEKEFSGVVGDAAKNANIGSYHGDALNKFIKAFNSFKGNNDVDILRDALDEVKSIRAGGRAAVKEFADNRRKEIKDIVKGIRSDIEDTRIEFDYEENKIAVDDTDFFSSMMHGWKSGDYASRTMEDLFGGAKSSGYKTFYLDFVDAQSRLMKERDKLEKTYRDLLYKTFKGDNTEASKYRIFSLFRRLSKEFSPERARSFLQDSSNLRLDNKGNLVVLGKNDVIPEGLFQLKDSDIDSIVDEIGKKIRINGGNMQKYDNFLQSTQKSIGARLEELFRKEYNVNFGQVEDYTKIKYLDGKEEGIDDSMDAMRIFTNPLAQLSKGFSKTTELRTGDYAIDFDEDNVFQSILNDQLRFIYIKEPLSRATRTLNSLASGKIDEGNSIIDDEGMDVLFKSLGFGETNRVETDMISQDAYRYIKDFLTIVANNGSGRSTIMDRRIAKFIYAKYLTFNPNSIISQFGSFTQMTHYDALSTTYAVANVRYADNFHFAGEISGYLASRRSSVLLNEFEEDKLAMESAGFIKKKVLGIKGIINSMADAWKRTVVDKSYTKLDFAMELGLSPMKMTDGAISTVAWIQGFKEWAKQNNISTGKLTNLRKLFDTLSEEQKSAARTFADNHMNKIMGATDSVAGKEFKGAMMRSNIILGKTTYNALRQTYKVIGDQKTGLGKVGKFAQALILNFLVNMGLEGAKAELAYRSGLRSNNELFPGFLTTIVKRANGGEIDPGVAHILDYVSRGLMAFVPATGVSVNEVFGITDSAISKIEAASKVSGERHIEELINTISKVLTPSNWAHTIVSNLTYQTIHGKSVIEVQDENYNLSKMKINPKGMTEDEITEAVKLNKDIRSSKAEADTIDGIPKTKYKEQLYSELYDKFNGTVPTPQEFMGYVKSNSTKFDKLGLRGDAKSTKAFYNDMRIQFSRSAGEVDSILSSADMDYIFSNRLKPYMDKGDTLGYKAELNRLFDKGVIKSKDGYNSWLKKYMKSQSVK